MSASSTPTFCPPAASAAARFTVTDDLPTPPLPLATAYTRVSEEGWANGISRSGAPAAELALQLAALLLAHHVQVHRAPPVTPGSAATAAVTSRVMVSRIGQPATVRYTSTLTAPSGPTSTLLTMPSSVIGPPDLGVVDPGQRLGDLLGGGRWGEG